jgi:hypothetical protein
LSDDRFELPEPPRTGPHRDFASILRGAGPTSHPDHGDAGCLDETSEAAGSFVADGVRSAYQVVDAYMRQGQRVARSLGLPTYQPPVPLHHMNDLSARWIQASSELMAIGFEFLGSLAENMAYGGIHPSRGPRGGEPAPGPRHPVCVRIEIASRRPARLDHEFLPGRETVALASHGLRSLDPNAATIPVEFEAEEHGNRVLVRVFVPDDQPPGLYTGSLLHAATGESVGTLSLHLR